MKYTLDTNVCIRVINGRSPEARTQLRSVPARDVTVCSIVRAELWYGSARSQTPEVSRRKQDLFLKPFATLPFDDAVADHYAVIRANLARQGQLIGALDMQIAAIALTHGLILVTHNTAEFARIPNLQVEDWQA